MSADLPMSHWSAEVEFHTACAVDAAIDFKMAIADAETVIAKASEDVARAKAEAIADNATAIDEAIAATEATARAIAYTDTTIFKATNRADIASQIALDLVTYTNGLTIGVPSEITDSIKTIADVTAAIVECIAEVNRVAEAATTVAEASIDATQVGADVANVAVDVTKVVVETVVTVLNGALDAMGIANATTELISSGFKENKKFERSVFEGIMMGANRIAEQVRDVALAIVMVRMAATKAVEIATDAAEMM